MKYKIDNHDKHLRVYEDKSEYHLNEADIETFPEGTISTDAKKRIKTIKLAFEGGFLDQLIVDLMKGKVGINVEVISPVALKSLNGLVDSLTSEVGRALVGLSVMQLCIKSIVPEQSIRLHKGSSNSASFSWVEGISMRTLDKNHVTPTLRRHDLLRLNADGFMMTRSLAENYPYTFLYKAKLRGAREQWLALVEELEKESTSPIESLKYLISRLINAASEFDKAANNLVGVAKENAVKFSNKDAVISIINQHSKESDYAARLLEVGMHALMQAAVETGAYGIVDVKPLSQMRSANKKHGNIGDIELLENNEIIVSWDAKYGKGYLREEIEEAVEKLESHDYVKTVGFVTNVEIERTKEIEKRVEEIKELYSVDLEVVSFTSWVDLIYHECLNGEFTSENELSTSWLLIYCEYLAQKRRAQAPIDEPCFDWVTSLIRIIQNA